jgi:PPOX class probable F420-dependent enzyme
MGGDVRTKIRSTRSGRTRANVRKSDGLPRLGGMSDDVLPEASTPFGELVRRRLRDEKVIWLTTVGGDGTPQPNPVWFVWEGSSFLVYNFADAKRMKHVRSRPQVSLNFDSDGRGGNIVVFAGVAEQVEDQPPAHEHRAYVEKYGQDMIQISGSQEAMSRAYPHALRVHVSGVRGF